MDQRSSDEALRRDIPSFIEPRPPLIHHPFMRPRPEKGINLLEKFEEVSDIEESELVQVYLRMKPCKIPNNLYELRSDKCLVTSLDTTTAGHGRRTQHNVSKMYTFSRIFKAESSQKEIFDQVVKDNLKRLVDGYSFTLLTYGASGSGKTYTVMGTVNSPGLVPRALEYLFKLVDAAQVPIFKPTENGTDELGYSQQDSELQWVKHLLKVSAPFRDKYRRMSAQLHSDLTVSSVDLTNRSKHYVWVSFVEIYNEAIYDLLAPPDKRVKLRLREDSAGNVYVKGVTQAFVRSGEEAYDVMVAGKHNLVVAATGIHARSSRSHCIFTITMLTEKDGEIRSSHVRLCDLAGSERQRAARNSGLRMQESRSINSSLHVLERCLRMLRRKQLTGECTMVPYRECKLTRLLGSGLSGARGEAVSLVVTVNPAPQYAHETRHVLALAVLAKDIQINNTIDPTVTTVSSLECTQDSTMHDYSDEIMRLRTENERLHFEIVQAQSCNAQLRRTMEETRQEKASALLEAIAGTKDMMGVFYERQLTSLRSQMQEMEDDYENRLAKLTEELEFMKKKLDSKDKSKEKLEESKGEEIQNRCERVEERDENEYEGRESPNSDPAYSSASDDESGSDNPLDESLEPVNQLRRSILHKEKEQRKETTIDLIHESSEEESENETNNDDSVYDKAESKKSVAPEESLANNAATSRDSLYATGDDYSEVENERQIENAMESTANFIQPVYKINDKNMTIEIEIAKNDADDANAENDKSECEELFNVSTKLDETQDVVEKHVMPTNLRGTYFVRNEPQKDVDVNEQFKTLNAVRGTDFEAHRETSFYKETNIENDNNKNKELAVKNKESPVKNKEMSKKKYESPPKFVSPKKVAETLVSKKIELLKTRQSSGGSLKQFEQLELAVNKADNVADAVKGIEITIPTQILKGKRYFDETAKEISYTIEMDTPIEKPNNGGKSIEKQSKYFEDKPDEISFYQMSSAAKKQERRLLFDSPETSLTSPEKQDKCNLETNENVQSLILTPKIVKEAQLYYTENDKVVHNDVLISRSPSIVRDDTTQEYEPSVAIRKILGESFTKTEILSSVRKDRLAFKKHESVDIFESPLSKASSKEIGNIEMTNDKNIEQPKDITEISSDKDRVVEIAHEFIDHLVASQKIKTYIKLEKLELEKGSASQDSADNINKHKNENIKEIKQEKLSLTSFNTEQYTIDNKEIKSEISSVTDNEIKLNQLNDTLSSKGNNTVDEFEKIVNDLTNVRPTEFELLVAEEDTALQNLPTQELDGALNAKEKLEMTDQIKNFEEARHNLRNKGKNVSDENKEIEPVAGNSKIKSTTKRCLRLRRRKNYEENSDLDNEKLKDIANLGKEFCDVIMDLPAEKKEVKDIPSPEKLPGEEENLPPMGIQSCPSKSVTRSRRKLFTPRAEPLEESPSQVGDSNERIYVPRPSYHRARARRRL